MLSKIMLTLTILSLFLSCEEDKGNAKDVFTKIYSTDSLPAQNFTINTEKDTTIKGMGGTILRIYKHSFTDSAGKPVSGDIQLEFKEAFTPADIILGNLTTTSNGKNLESGGMIWLNATQDNKQLSIAGDKIIGVLLPRSRQDSGMQVFEGVKDSTGINWKNPAPLLNEKIKRRKFESTYFTFSSPAFRLTDTVREKKQQDSMDREVNETADILMKEYTDIQQDTTIEVKGKQVWMTKPVKRKIVIDTLEGGETRLVEELLLPKGINLFIPDFNTNYIFSVKKLGWANIDRLYDDPRTKEVDLITSIENAADFNMVYVSLLIDNKKMYIPGYQKKDNTFSFTHNDEEKTRLPIGETAVILATAYKKGKPYFAIQKIKIDEKQRVSFKLTETTMDKLKDQLKIGI